MIEKCPYPLYSGVEDAEIVCGYCEIGCGCNPKCQYSWNEDEEEKVNKLFWEYCVREAIRTL